MTIYFAISAPWAINQTITAMVLPARIITSTVENYCMDRLIIFSLLLPAFMKVVQVHNKRLRERKII